MAANETPGTDYVVLSGTAEDVWSVHGTYRASNDKVAIRSAIHDGLASDEAAYVAVPVRSWQPRTPTIDAKPTVRF